jgi:mannose-6-phosphate isomerase class I
MLDCFDRSALGGEALEAVRPRPARLSGGGATAWLEEDLLGAQSHAFFRAHRLTVKGVVEWPYSGIYAVVIVTGGQGVAETVHGRIELRRGDSLAMLAATAPTTIRGDVELVVAMPGLA